MSYQLLVIQGNITKDLEMRYNPKGTAVLDLNVAVDVGFGEYKETQWWKVTAWGKLAETCNQYLHKGAGVICEGEIKGDKETGNPRIWTGKDGTPHASFEMTARTIRFTDKKGSNGGNGNSGYSKNDAGPEDDSESIPF
jgi:single-strand DNA-binding protein